MKHLSAFCLLCCVWTSIFSQAIVVSDSFQMKLNLSGLIFTEPRIAPTSGVTSRVKVSNCDMNKKLEAQASYILKGAKSSAIVLYRIKPMKTRSEKLGHISNDFAQICCSQSIETLSEGEVSDSLTKDIPEITKILNADWVKVSAFSCKKKWKDCTHYANGYHVFIFKAGKGYAEIMVFYDNDTKEDKDFIREELNNIITSISFKVE